MITVYVESNFILELALEQEEFEECQNIIELCRKQQIKLVLPAYSLIEPNEKLIRTARNRENIFKTLSEELTQLKRTASYKEGVEKKRR